MNDGDNVVKASGVHPGAGHLLFESEAVKSVQSDGRITVIYFLFEGVSEGMTGVIKCRVEEGGENN